MVEKRPSPGDYAEGLGAVAGFAFFRLLPLDWASALGGWMARTVGPRLGISKRARENLRRAMPELTPTQRERIVRGMWDNLGRVLAEYPHLKKFRLDDASARFLYEDGGNLRGGSERGQRTIFFSAHCGNWELVACALGQLGFHGNVFYRAPNNPLVDRLLLWIRGRDIGEFVPKGAAGARRAYAALLEGRDLGMLIDQKMNDGIAVPFFGRAAMTGPALAALALRFDCAVVPARVVRLKGAHFRVISEPALALPRSGDAAADRLQLMTAVNAVVERWVREHPEQWLWLHRRWPD